MQEIRCGECGKKLAMALYTKLSIKCPRCKRFNEYELRAMSSEAECHRASDLGATLGQQPDYPLAGRQTQTGR